MRDHNVFGIDEKGRRLIGTQAHTQTKMKTILLCKYKYLRLLGLSRKQEWRSTKNRFFQKAQLPYGDWLFMTGHI